MFILFLETLAMFRAHILGRVGGIYKHSSENGNWYSVSIAHNFSVKNPAGIWEDETLWVTCNVYGKKYEKVLSMLNVGAIIFVSGDLSKSMREGREYWNIAADTLQVADWGRRGAKALEDEGATREEAMRTDSVFKKPFAEDDIPF